MALLSSFELVFDEKQKAIVRDYIFGLNSTTIADLEKTVSQKLIRYYVNEANDFSFISVFKITAFSSALIFITLCIFFETTYIDVIKHYYTESGALTAIGCVLYILLLNIALSYPSDVASLYITKLIFFNKDRSFSKSAFFILVDFLMSILFAIATYIVIVGVFYYTSINTNSILTMSLNGGVVGSLIVSASITILQAAVIMLGAVSRLLILFFNINFQIAMRSGVSNHPFAYMGMVVSAFYMIAVFLNYVVILLGV